MIKRLFVLVAVGLLAVLVVPSVASAQSEESSEVQEPEAVTEPEPVTEEQEVIEEEEVVTEETGSEQTSEEGASTDAPETDAIEPQLAGDGEVSTASADGAATPTAVNASTTTSISTISTSKKGKKARSARGKKSAKRCATSSHAGGPVAQVSAPPAPGCGRVNGNQGQIVLPDGTTLNVNPTGNQGEVTVTVTAGTFTGTIFVKGGPADPGESCGPFSGLGVGSTVTCVAPFNPNSGKLYGVSHVDACPGAAVPPGTTTTPTPPGGGSQGGRGGGQQREEQQKRKKAAAEERAQPAPAAQAAVAAPAGQLPVTGLPVAWLVLVGGVLVASGFTLRRLT